MAAHNPLSTGPVARHTAAIAMVALIGIGYCLAIIVVMHFLRPDYNPTRNTISEYAIGPYGILMISGLFALGLGSFAVVIGLYQGLSQPARSWVGLLLLGLWAVGTIVGAIFPTDLQGAPKTPSGSIHGTASFLSIIGLVSGTIALSRRFKKDERWKPFHRTALILSLVMLLTFIISVVGFILLSDFVGLIQRILIAAMFTWFLLTAARLRSIAIESGSK
jgi:hypothetical protein